MKGKIPPVTDLTVMGPVIDLEVGKTHFAEYELIKDAIEQPKSLVAHEVEIFCLKFIFCSLRKSRTLKRMMLVVWLDKFILETKM